MKNNFKWSELELLNDDTIPELTIKELDSICTFDDMDYTVIQGFCEDCGKPFEWAGLFKDMPEHFCCGGK